MPGARLKVGDTLQAARASFEENRALILKMTLAFAALVAISSLLDVAGPAGLAISFGISILLGAVYNGMVTALICTPGSPQELGELWTVVRPVLARLIWVTLITAVCVGVGIAILIVPGLVILTLWSVGGQVVVVERAPVFTSLGRSFRLVKDTAWQVFGYLVVIGLVSLLMLALALVASYPLGTGAVAGLVSSFLVNLLSTPVVAIGSAVLYTKLTGLDSPEPSAEPDDSAVS